MLRSTMPCRIRHISLTFTLASAASFWYFTEIDIIQILSPPSRLSFQNGRTPLYIRQIEDLNSARFFFSATSPIYYFRRATSCHFILFLSGLHHCAQSFSRTFERYYQKPTRHLNLIFRFGRTMTLSPRADDDDIREHIWCLASFR